LPYKHKLIELARKSTEIVEKNNHPVYWQANDFKFCNRNLMHWYEKEFGVFAEAVATQLPSIRENLLDKSIDDNINYSVEYLKKIRSQYDHLIFMFSGGYDSTTVFLDAVENNIFFDTVISHTSGDYESPENIEIVENVLPWIEQFKGKYGNFEILPHSVNLLQEIYSDPWALFIMPEMGSMPFTFRRIYVEYENRQLPENSCHIKSIDKPQLFFYQNNWYVYSLDANFGGSMNLKNQLFFWYEGDNIKSLIKDARNYRNVILQQNNNIPNTTFFKSYNSIDETKILNRRSVYKKSMQLLKQSNNSYSEKDLIAFKRAVDNNDFLLLSDYFNCLNLFYEIFPEYKADNGFNLYNQKNKFPWLINIDTLEVYTQQELLPIGIIKE
jgi:hypothetical protein